jgi:glycerophosphoryl diester phosphodiesterase
MKVRVLAHRGYPAKYPENTLSSFRAACELGASDLELDVQLSRDGVPVIIHDFSVDRMTDGSGAVKSLTLDQLKRLKVGEDEQIPTLEEALALLKGKVKVHLELKQTGNLYPELEVKVADAVRKLDMTDQVMLISFDHDALVRVRQIAPEIAVGLIAGQSSPAFLPFIMEIGARSLSMKYACVTEPYIRWCEEQGIEFVAWTINEPDEMRAVRRYPSILACTDQLERWIETSRGEA